MGKLSLFIFVGFLTIATCSETGLRLLFPIENRQYIYELKTNVSISTQPVSNKSSLWLLEGVLMIQSFDNFTKARIHLDVRRKTLIGNTGNYEFYELEGDKFLKNPWELDYQDNGFIKSIYVSEEPTWCVNLKRAISVNFQLTRNTGASSTYSMNEPCLDEICVMVYTIRGNSIRKYTSFRVPTARSSYSWGSVPWNVEYTGLLYVDSISASERNYEMDSQKGLITLDLKGSYQYKTHDHLLSVTSDLYLNFKEDIPAKSIEKLNLSQTTIQYVAGDFSDPTNGIANFTQFHLTNKSYTILLKIARKGIDSDNIVRNASLIHNLDFIELLNTMSQLHYESLIKLFNDLVLGTSYDMETSRNIFLEILPHLRSDACARFIKYLVLEEKDGIPSQVIPVDYQMIHFGNPILDFFYLVFAGTDQEFRRNHMIRLKELYYHSLKTFLEYFNLDVEEAFPIVEFEKQFKEKMDFGLMTSFFFLPLMFPMEGEVLDFTNAEHGAGLFKIDSQYQERIRDIVDDFITWGYLDEVRVE